MANTPGEYSTREGDMATFSGSMARNGRALALAASTMAVVTSPVLAGDFTQDQCKGIRSTAAEVIRGVGKDTLSIDFRQSFVNWLGPDLRCDGPKDIIIVTNKDSVAYATIRDMLISGSKPLSLQKAGLRIVVREKTSPAQPQTQQQRSDASAAPRPVVN